MIASMTWQEASCRGTTRTNISDIIYHQPACHSTYSPPSPGAGKNLLPPHAKDSDELPALSLGVLSKNYYAY